jgi:hypothetical protein
MNETQIIVPIINFKEVPKPDWRRLPKIISNRLRLHVSHVICTHHDQVTYSSALSRYIVD